MKPTKYICSWSGGRMTHKELIVQAHRKLENWGCYPILTELVAWSATGEIPDAIGWTGRASILIECKASRSDFLRDREKLFRYQLPESGVGDFRFYITNENVIQSVDEMPDGWGCYEIKENRIEHKFGVRYTNCCPIPLTGNKKEELRLMRSFFRRREKE